MDLLLRLPYQDCVWCFIGRKERKRDVDQARSRVANLQADFVTSHFSYVLDPSLRARR